MCIYKIIFISPPEAIFSLKSRLPLKSLERLSAFSGQKSKWVRYFF